MLDRFMRRLVDPALDRAGRSLAESGVGAAGLAEGTETILFFSAMILWPAWFPVLAHAFAGLTLISALARVVLAWQAFRDNGENE
jgi:hypothetical protein